MQQSGSQWQELDLMHVTHSYRIAIRHKKVITWKNVNRPLEGIFMSMSSCQDCFSWPKPGAQVVFSRARPSLYRRGEYINLWWQNKLHSLTPSKKRSKFQWTYQSVACCVDTEVWHCAYLRKRLVLVWCKRETSAHIINIVFYSV